MAKRGPKLKLTGSQWEAFDKLCAIHATLSEIADFFDCCEDTIESAVKRDKGMKFSEYFRLKRGAGRISLRRNMYQGAMKGNVALQIFLAKNWLGMSDRQTLVTEDEDGGKKPVNGFVFIKPEE